MVNILQDFEAIEHIRLDTSADMPWLRMMIPAVESAVIRWCGGESNLYDEDNNLIPCVKTAILVELAYQYLHREGPVNTKTMEWYGKGYTLSAGATAMLQSLRAPRVA